MKPQRDLGKHKAIKLFLNYSFIVVNMTQKNPKSGN